MPQVFMCLRCQGSEMDCRRGSCWIPNRNVHRHQTIAGPLKKLYFRQPKSQWAPVLRMRTATHSLAQCSSLLRAGKFARLHRTVHACLALASSVRSVTPPIRLSRERYVGAVCHLKRLVACPADTEGAVGQLCSIRHRSTSLGCKSSIQTLSGHNLSLLYLLVQFFLFACSSRISLDYHHV